MILTNNTVVLAGHQMPEFDRNKINYRQDATDFFV